MRLFGKKKGEDKACCGGNCDPKTMVQAEMEKSMDAAVKILGSGCANCNQLEVATREALMSLGMEATIEHVTDFARIATYGVMTTPALVVDGKVLSHGKVLKKEAIIALLQKTKA